MGFSYLGVGQILVPHWGGGISYLLRDKFTTDAAAPLASPRTAEPGPGTLTLTQTDGQFSTSGGTLLWSAQTTPTYGDLVVRGAAFSRVVGRALFGTLILDSAGFGPLFGWSNNATPGANSIYGVLWTVGPASHIRALGNSYASILPNYPVSPTSQKYCIIQQDLGFVVLAYESSKWLFKWYELTGSDATLYPALEPYNMAGSLDDLEVYDLGGGWLTRYGAAYARIASPATGNTINTLADGQVELTWTPGAAETLTILFRRTDDDNCWKLVCDQAAGTIKLYKRDTGSDTEVDAGKTQTWTVGTAYRIVIYFVGNAIKTFVASGIKHSTSDTYLNTATGAAASGFATATNFVAWPSEVGPSGPFISSSLPALNTLSISSPAPFRVFQRSGATGSITISGTFNAAGTHDIEASFNGGAYSTIASGVTAGSFTGTLTGQAAGQGTLTVRLVDATGVSATVATVGIGDVFIIAGQSNAMGYGTNNQSYSHASLKACEFGNDYLWKELTDPLDSSTNQVDAVSNDGGAPGGSVWLLIATSFLADQSVPVAFVPCAKGATGITEWQPGVNHQDRTTLYGSMVYRALQTGAKAVLLWQGEDDAIDGMNQATYNAWLDALANAIQADLGVKIMPCKLQNCTGILADRQAAINAAIGEAWLDNANVLTGPDLSGLTTDDEYHLTTDVNLAAAATLWWNAIAAALYP